MSSARDRAEPAWLTRSFSDVRPRLKAYALKLTLGSEQDAEDLVQDTLERGLKASARFREGADPAVWLITILHRRFIDHLRSKRRRSEVALLEDADFPAPADESPSPWTDVGPDRLWAAVAQLEEPYRTVFQLHAREGRSYGEIAHELSIQTSNVGVRLLRARHLLRRMIFKTGDEPSPRKPSASHEELRLDSASARLRRR